VQNLPQLRASPQGSAARSLRFRPAEAHALRPDTRQARFRPIADSDALLLSDGAEELRNLLPRTTFVRFADVVGAKDRQAPTWKGLRESFSTHMEQRIKVGKLQPSTQERYNVTLREFEEFLSVQKIGLLQDINKPLVESFKVWRIERIRKQKNSRGATGLVLDAAILHRAFAFAVENEMILKNPVRMEGRPGENPEHGAEPFTAPDLSRLRDHAADELLTFSCFAGQGFAGRMPSL